MEKLLYYLKKAIAGFFTWYRFVEIVLLVVMFIPVLFLWIFNPENFSYHLIPAILGYSFICISHKISLVLDYRSNTLVVTEKALLFNNEKIKHVFNLTDIEKVGILERKHAGKNKNFYKLEIKTKDKKSIVPFDGFGSNNRYNIEKDVKKINEFLKTPAEPVLKMTNNISIWICKIVGVIFFVASLYGSYRYIFQYF